VEGRRKGRHGVLHNLERRALTRTPKKGQGPLALFEDLKEGDDPPRREEGSALVTMRLQGLGPIIGNWGRQTPQKKKGDFLREELRGWEIRCSYIEDRGKDKKGGGGW